jgi:putative Holliday junction resolvase
MPEAGPRPVQVVLALDFGLARIGVASGDSLTRSAAPRPALAVGATGPDWRTLATLVAELRPDLLVVGAPYNDDGSASPMTDRVQRFAAELEARHRIPVRLVDERYSSLEASARLKAGRASGARRHRVRKEDVDSTAAAVILERWWNGEA